MFLALAVLLTVPQAVTPQTAPVVTVASVASGAAPAARAPRSDGSAESSSVDVPAKKVAASPASASFVPLPAQPVPFRVETPSPRNRKTWYALTAVGHGAATFDAWSTRRVISSSQGRELNPLLRPFADSGALYAAVQVGPTFFDYLGKRMMRSERRWMRKLWWMPQALGAGASVVSGVHNLHVAK